MKKVNLVLGVAAAALMFTSCKDEAKETAHKNVDHYVVFVDSVNGLDEAEREANWEAIQAEYELRLAKADSALAVLENDAETATKVTESKTKYETVKTVTVTKVQEKQAAAAAPSGLADTLFGAGTVVGNDMTFAWVNKDNILSVYQKFYETFDANKDDYTRQDLDKIKGWYEALDNRKNTVEKEGLSSEDNGKIANLKLKFGPKFKWERMTAKGEENDDAKDAAN
jgi:hypothetical protein